MLDANATIAQAEAHVGISDSDPGVPGNLQRLVAAIGETFPISEAGEVRIRSMLMMDATNRLESLKWLRDCPEIGHEVIEAPVFLMGLPRSGTTYFQYLFARTAKGARAFRRLRGAAPV